MKYQLLPHYFKYIGLSIFIIAMLPDGISSFMEGYKAGYSGETLEYILQSREIFGLFLSKAMIVFLNSLSIIGIIMYALSKDKVFDEFLLKLRFESIQIVFFLSVLTLLITYVISPESKIDAITLINMQLLAFLIIHKIRKLRFEITD